MRFSRFVVFLLLWLVTIALHSGAAATSPQPVSQLEPQAPPPFPGEQQQRDDPERARLEREQQRKRNKERFQSLQQDTNKLLTLATELKQYVDKANENTLSLDVLRKTDEIDKLAKTIHEKMKAE